MVGGGEGGGGKRRAMLHHIFSPRTFPGRFSVNLVNRGQTGTDTNVW